MATQAIRNEGSNAEDLFIGLLSNATTSDNAKLGDAIVDVDGESHYVELKECHAEV